MTPSRFVTRKKIKSDIKNNKSVIRRKFDKTYKYLSLQLDLDLTSFENTSVQTTNRQQTKNDSALLPNKDSFLDYHPNSAKSHVNPPRIRNSVNYMWSAQMKIMQDSREALSEMNSFDRNTASQTALS